MRRVAVIGVGVTKFGKHDRTLGRALRRGGASTRSPTPELPASAVQALYYGNVVGGETEKQLHTGPQAASVLGIPTVPTTRFETACASSHAAFRHAVMDDRLGRLGRRPGRRRRARAERDDRGVDRVLRLRLRRALGAAARPHLPRRLRAGRARPHDEVRHHRGADGRGRREEPQARRAEPEGAVPEGDHARAGAQVADGRRSAQALRLLPVHRRRRRPRARLRGGRAQGAAAHLGAGLGGGVRLDADRRQARPLARAGHRARGGGGLPPGGARPDRRGRRRAARLLHDRRDRRHRGARPLRAGRRRPRRREGLDEPRRQDARQPVGRAQGQGPSHRRHRRRADRRDRHPAPRRRRPAPGRRRQASGSPTRSAATPPPCSCSLFGRD